MARTVWISTLGKREVREVDFRGKRFTKYYYLDTVSIEGRISSQQVCLGSPHARHIVDFHSGGTLTSLQHYCTDAPCRQQNTQKQGHQDRSQRK